MKILLTGASGLVGNAFAREAMRRGHQIIAIHNCSPLNLPGASTSMQMDLNDTEQLVSTALDIFPDAIVNAAAISSPGAVDEDPALAKALNVVLPARLAELANHVSARFIHLSTDMVFDGTQGDYRSSDPPAPSNRYGELKAEAEHAVLRMAAPFTVVLRIAIVTGDSPGGRRSVHEKLMEQWARGEKTPLYTDEIRQPNSALNTGEVMVELLERNNLSGLFHWAGAQRMSRYEMGLRICEHFKLNPEDYIEAAELVGTGRPADLGMNLAPLVGKLKTLPAPFSEQLDSMSVPAHIREWYDSVVPKDMQPRQRFRL